MRRAKLVPPSPKSRVLSCRDSHDNFANFAHFANFADSANGAESNQEATMSADKPRTDPDPGAPWWRYGMVWLVLSGPAVVVVASFVSAYLAYHGADPVVIDTAPERQAVNPTRPGGITPALVARNHAATPAEE